MSAQIRVKSLSWTEPHISTTYPEWRTVGLAFEAVIDKSKPLHFGKFPLRINGRHTPEKFETLKAAKAFAQAKYDAQILATLDLSPTNPPALYPRYEGEVI